MQPFLRRDTSKVADTEYVRVCVVLLRSIIIQVDSKGDDVDLGWRNLQITGHELSVEATDRNKSINSFGVFANQLQCFTTIGFVQIGDVKVFSLQRTTYGTARRFFERTGETAEQ